MNMCELKALAAFDHSLPFLVFAVFRRFRVRVVSNCTFNKRLTS